MRNIIVFVLLGVGLIAGGLFLVSVFLEEPVGTGKVISNEVILEEELKEHDEALNESRSESRYSGGGSGGGGGGGSGGGGAGGSEGGEDDSINLPPDIDSVECGFYFEEYGVCRGTCPSGKCVSEGKSCYCKRI